MWPKTEETGFYGKNGGKKAVSALFVRTRTEKTNRCPTVKPTKRGGERTLRAEATPVRDVKAPHEARRRAGGRKSHQIGGNETANLKVQRKAAKKSLPSRGGEQCNPSERRAVGERKTVVTFVERKEGHEKTRPRNKVREKEQGAGTENRERKRGARGEISATGRDSRPGVKK